MSVRAGVDKPPLPKILEPAVAEAKARHRQRHANPGVAVEVEKTSKTGYVLASPHSDTDAWQAMICDALGTRSDATAQTFLSQLTELCTPSWRPAEDPDGPGEWCPDERELNFILNFVAGVRPRNEMEAALAAQMVGVHLVQMRLLARTLGSGYVVAEDAAVLSKLARTFVTQIEAMAKLKGGKTSRQKITVKHEKHVHTHQHVHIEGGASENGSQAHGTRDAGAVQLEGRPALPSPDSSGVVVPMPRYEGKEPVPDSRRSKRLGGSEG